MRDADDAPTCDGCDTNLRNVEVPGASDRRRRFLDAYRRDIVVASAARMAGVHRATVYRWKADPEFVAEMQAAVEEFFRNHRAKVAEADAARRALREEREKARHPMRCHYLAQARAAKRR